MEIILLLLIRNLTQFKSYYFLSILFLFNLLFLLCDSSSSSAGKKPTLVRAPTDIYGLLNQQITLHCQSSKSTDLIQWLKDGELIDSKRSTLTLQLTTESEGNYFCNVSNSNSFILSPKASVKIAFLNNFSRQLKPSTKYVSPGSTLVLECPTPDGLPKPKVRWMSDLSSSSNHRFKLDTEYNLRIDNVVRADSGSYWCEVQNLAVTRKSPPIKVVVRQRPVFLILPKHVQVMVTSSVVFPCIVSGDMPMFVHWYKLGSSNNDETMSRSQIGSNCSLIIRNVKLEDKGAYACQARNSGGVTEIIFKLNVISLPAFYETPFNTKSMLGSSVGLRCSAFGVPDPKIIWYHKNEYISDYDSSDERRFVYENGTLFIKDIRSEDAGRYVCYAVSLVGISKSECTLTVQMPDRIFPPIISVVPLNITSYEGATVVLKCGTSQKKSQFSWYKKSMRILNLNSRYTLLKNGDLTIRNLKVLDSALFTCRVSSYGLFSERSAYLTVKSYGDLSDKELAEQKNSDNTNSKLLLEAPKNVTIDYIGDRYLLVGWKSSAVSNSASVRYAVEIAEMYRNSWRSVGETRERKLLIKNLKPNTGYKLLIRSVRGHKIGHYTLYNQVVYTLNKPTIGPEMAFQDFHKSLQEIEIYGVKLVGLSSRQIEVSWKVRAGSILRSISGFIIKAEPVNIKRCFLSQARTFSEKAAVSFNCLESQSRFQNNFAALIGQFDDRVIDKNVKRQRYTVFRTITMDKTEASAIIGNLDPFMCYEVEIETFIDHIKAGRIAGRDSKGKTVLTFDDLPMAAPKIVKFRWIGNETFFFSWEVLDSKFSNGPVIGYSIQMINIQNKQQYLFEVDSNTLQYQLRMNSQGHPRMIYISAKSCRGLGPRSAPILINRNNRAVLAAMGARLIRNGGGGGGQLEWFDGDDDGGGGGNYATSVDDMERVQNWKIVGFIIGTIFLLLILIGAIVSIVVCRKNSAHNGGSYGGHNSRNDALISNYHGMESVEKIQSGPQQTPHQHHLHPQQQQQHHPHQPLISPAVGGIFDHSYNVMGHNNNNNNNLHQNMTNDQQKLLSNYETILPMNTVFTTQMDHSACSMMSAVANPTLGIRYTSGSGGSSGVATNSSSGAGNINNNSISNSNNNSAGDTLAYASSSIICKGSLLQSQQQQQQQPQYNNSSLTTTTTTTSTTNPNNGSITTANTNTNTNSNNNNAATMNLPPNYGPFIDVFPTADQKFIPQSHMLIDPTLSGGSFIPPPPLYPPPPAPSNQITLSSDMNSDPLLSSSAPGSHQNTASHSSASNRSSSNNKTRLSRNVSPPQSINPSSHSHSSSSSKGRRKSKIRKSSAKDLSTATAASSSGGGGGGGGGPGSGGSLSNSTHSSSHAKGNLPPVPPPLPMSLPHDRLLQQQIPVRSHYVSSQPQQQQQQFNQIHPHPHPHSHQQPQYQQHHHHHHHHQNQQQPTLGGYQTTTTINNQPQYLPYTTMGQQLSDGVDADVDDNVADDEDEDEEEEEINDDDDDEDDDEDDDDDENNYGYKVNNRNTRGFDNNDADDSDSVRAIYKMNFRRPNSTDYNTDSSYPYSIANHYSSGEPPVTPTVPVSSSSATSAAGGGGGGNSGYDAGQVNQYNNLPTKF